MRKRPEKRPSRRDRLADAVNKLPREILDQQERLRRKLFEAGELSEENGESAFELGVGKNEKTGELVGGKAAETEATYLIDMARRTAWRGEPGPDVGTLELSPADPDIERDRIVQTTDSIWERATRLVLEEPALKDLFRLSKEDLRRRLEEPATKKELANPVQNCLRCGNAFINRGAWTKRWCTPECRRAAASEKVYNEKRKARVGRVVRAANTLGDLALPAGDRVRRIADLSGESRNFVARCIKTGEIPVLQP